MLDLLIINPMAAHGIYGPLGDDLIAVEPPLWCRLLAGYVREAGFSVQILDAEAERFAPETAAVFATEVAKPKVICIAVYGHQPSASTQQMWGAGKLASALRRCNTTADVFMVGGHPSALPQTTILDEEIDYVAVGEGAITLVEYLKGEWKDRDTVPGLVWKEYRGEDVEVRFAPPAPLINDLSKLHGYAWDLLPMDKYRAHNWQCFGDLSKRQPYASIYTSLGCPYKCSFCCINAPFASNRYRMRNPDDVVDEIEYLYEEHGISTLKITDEMFVLKERHYMDIVSKLIGRGLGQKLNIWAYARVDTVKPGTLALMRKAGIQWLALGIESGSKHVRHGANKALKQDDIVTTVKEIQNAGINVIGNFMFGLRDDNLTTMMQTLDLANQCLPDFANFYSTMAYPGSGLYEQAVRNGWRLPASWKGYSQHNDECTPLDTEHLNAADVLRFRDDAFVEFFTSPRYLRHVRDKFGGEAVEHVEQMTQYKLKRKLLEAA